LQAPAHFPCVFCMWPSGLGGLDGLDDSCQRLRNKVRLMQRRSKSEPDVFTETATQRSGMLPRSVICVLDTNMPKPGLVVKVLGRDITRSFTATEPRR